MDILNKIDEALKKTIEQWCYKLFFQWPEDYKIRIYGEVEKDHEPPPNSDCPGFESNILSLLFNVLMEMGLDPHTEWPYASYVAKSRLKSDIHLISDGTEAWIEIGMYASDEEKKYDKDFEKLSKVIDESINNIGVLIHFDVYKKNEVKEIFKSIKGKNEVNKNYKINIKHFPYDSLPLVSRLSVQQKKITNYNKLIHWWGHCRR